LPSGWKQSKPKIKPVQCAEYTGNFCNFQKDCGVNNNDYYQKMASKLSLTRFLDDNTGDVNHNNRIDSSEKFLKTPSLEFVDDVLAKQKVQVNTDSFLLSQTKLVTYGENNQKIGPLMTLNYQMSAYYDKKTDTVFKFKLWQE